MNEKPSILRTEAVVLRSMDYGETSRIVTLFTREMGKIGVMAKGARNPKSRFGSTLDPLSHIQVIIYYKPTRDLQSLTEASHVRAYTSIRDSLRRIEVGLRIIELTNSLMQVEQQNLKIFTLLVSVIAALAEVDERFENLLPFYQLRLASILGFAPSFEKEIFDEMGREGGRVELDSGVIRSGSGGTGYTAGRSVLRAFAILARAPLVDVLRMSLRPKIRSGVEGLIAEYMKYHFEDAYPNRSERVFSQLGRA